MLANRLDQFQQHIARKILPRLQRARDNARQFDLVHSLARIGCVSRRSDRRSADQRAKTFTQSRACHASRLPEQSSQRKQQSTGVPKIAARPEPLRTSFLIPSRHPGIIPEKTVKKSIDTRNQNSVSTRNVPKQTKDFCPVGFFVCSDPVRDKKQSKHDR